MCILYISTSIEQAITDVKNITQFSLKIHLFLSYMPIMTAALMISEVHRKVLLLSHYPLENFPGTAIFMLILTFLLAGKHVL